VKPTRVIVVFDGKGGSASRKKVFSGYKAGRENNKLRVNRQYADMMNEEDERESMKRQYVWLSELIHELPMSTMIYDGVEADDVMGYIATQLLKEDEQAVLMSTDKDFLQLVNEKTIVWSPTKKKIYNKQTLKEEYGLESQNMLIYRVLDGDKSDGIPGVKGIGIKTLLKRFPEIAGEEKISIEKLLELAEEGKKTSKIKLFDNILNSKEQLLMNQRLMQLKDPVIPGDTKLKIMEVFDEPLKPVNKLGFFKVCMKYKVINNMGDINKWLHTTFGNLVTD
jgi:DNA polymerase-1